MLYNRIKMKKSICCWIVLFFACYGVVAQPVRPAVSDRLLVSDKAVPQGYMRERLDQSYENRILAQDVEALIEPFRKRTETRFWQSEFWGKWFTSAVLAYRYRPEDHLRDILRSAVDGIISTQTRDGYIGNYEAGSHLKQWDIWGRKYTLLGLLD